MSTRHTRIQKRDAPVVQVRKLIDEKIKQSITKGSTIAGATYSTLYGGGGAPTDDGSRVKVLSLGIVGGTPGTAAPVNRAQLNPQGSLYAVDDPADDFVLLRNSPLMDPTFILRM